MLAVFAAHLHAPWAYGGFVGVDLFFVISGYVIARSVADRQREGTFTLRGFWDRRVRRLAPALAVVLAVTSALAVMTLMPQQMASFGRSALAAVTFCANLLFWRETDYFFGEPDLHPLLHTWTLGVEEQVYLAFPIVMLVIGGWRRSMLLTFLALAAATSLAMAFALAQFAPAAAFYLPVTRGWEFLLGAMLAVAAIPSIRGKVIRSVLGLFGLAAVLASIRLAPPSQSMAHIAALAACVGTVLLILAGESTPTGRLLGLAVLRFFGRISYGLYLWHWPLICAQHLLFGIQASGWIGDLVVFGSAVTLAWLSSSWLERPILEGRLLKGRRLYVVLATVLLPVVGLALVAVASNGLPQRIDPAILTMLDKAQRPPSRNADCLPTPGGSLSHFPQACISRDAGRPNWLLVGDSHADHLWYGLSKLYPSTNISQATVSSCSLLRQARPQATPQCARLTAELYGEVLAHHRPDMVVLSAAWRPDEGERLAETLAWFKAHGIPVTLVGPAPRYEQRAPLLLAQARYRADPGLPERRRLSYVMDSETVVRRAAEKAGVPFVSPLQTLCGDGPCRLVTPDGLPIQWDEHHFSKAGSLWIAEALFHPAGTPVVPAK